MTTTTLDHTSFVIPTKTANGQTMYAAIKTHGLTSWDIYYLGQLIGRILKISDTDYTSISFESEWTTNYTSPTEAARAILTNSPSIYQVY